MRAAIVGALLLAGQATYYNPGVFERVWEYRRSEMPACPDCVGFAAMLDEEHLGQRVWVSNGREWIGPLYVIDVAAPQHRAMLVRRGWVIDLPHWLAVRWQMAGPIEVSVSFTAPATQPPAPPGCVAGQPC